jgi:alcohol dehydrogenase class IV
MSSFEFATATRIIFGAGSVQQLSPLAAELGRRALVVVGRSPERTAPVLEQLAAQRVATMTFQVVEEPTIAIAQEGTRLAREAGCELVIGIGGGSVLDAGKAIAALLTNPGDPLDYLEIIGAGKPLTHSSAPYVAVPTTAGTGAEVTRNAVLGSPEHGVKVSLRSPTMLPRVALVDPELAYSLPPDVTASTGLDALTQLIEPYVSNRANPLTDLFCRDGIVRVARSLRRAFEDGSDRPAREDMALASLYGGLALANARLGAVHGFAGPIGGQLLAPHGAICARLLPIVMAANLHALTTRQPDHPALPRYTEVARLLTGDQQAPAEAGVAWVETLCKLFGIPPLATYGLTPAAFPELVQKAAAASSMQGNPIKLQPDELHEILARA